MGDFNARVGAEHDQWPLCLGREGVGKMNENGQRVLEICASSNLCVTNTYFPGKLSRKTSWRHPRSNHWHQLDLILTRRSDLKCILHTRSYQSADCNTDHSLVCCKVNFILKKIHRIRNKSNKRIDIADVKNLEKRQMFENEMSEVIIPDRGVHVAWPLLRDSLHTAASNSFGTTSRKSADWFESSASILAPLVETKRKTLLQYKNIGNQENLAALRISRNNFLSTARICENQYWNDLSSEIQCNAECGNIKGVYDGIRRAIGPTKKMSAPLLDLEGNLIHDKEKQMARWIENYTMLYGTDSEIDYGKLQDLPQFEVVAELEDMSTLNDLRSAIKEMSNHKSPGSDGLPAEIFKVLDGNSLLKFYEIIELCWTEEEVPQDFIDPKFIQLYKNKGSRNDCNNYRGISLLNIAGKILSRIILPRLQKLGERIYPESQCGFRSGRSTVDMIFSLRQVQEKCREKSVPLYCAFVDLVKAFDKVSRRGLFLILEKLGCPPKLLNIVKSFHVGMMARVSFNGEESEDFRVNCGVKQGCVLAPTLFNIYFSYLLQYTFQNNVDGIYMHFRMDGGLFNIRRFQAKTKVTDFRVTDLLFADDAAIVTHDPVSLQRLLNKLSEACNVFGLTISTSKTVVMQQGVDHIRDFYLNGELIENVDKFCYLGSTVSFNLNMDEEISSRIGKAASTFGSLQKRVWNNRKLSIKTKVNVYNACILTALLYGSEGWTTYAHQLRRLNGFHCRCLRKILGIKWYDGVTNVEVLARANSDSIHTQLSKRRLRWIGHVKRMDNHRLPKKIFYGEIKRGKRKVGRPLLRYSDSVKRDLTHCNVMNWEETAENRSAWRQMIREGIVVGEESWRSGEEERRIRRQIRRAHHEQ